MRCVERSPNTTVTTVTYEHPSLLVFYRAQAFKKNDIQPKIPQKAKKMTFHSA